MSRQHNAIVAGQSMDYVAAFDRFAVKDSSGHSAATITTISYLRPGKGDDRPIVFAFNGGPGSTSIYLHAGLLGPKRIELPADPKLVVPAHAPLVANADSILDVADIVLIDPVGTGYSRLLSPAARPDFYSVRGDARSIASAIQSWVRAHGRARSPKYLMGESYGAVRAAFVAAALLKDAQADTLNGVIMLSQSLQIVDTVQRRSNTVGQIIGMPTLAASAWYHGLAGKGLPMERFVADAANFARVQWLPALIAGTRINPEELARVARQLSAYTGISTEYLIAHDLYIPKEDYRRLALADRGLALGLYDTRYTGPLSASGEPDEAVSAALEAAASDIFRSEFGLGAADYLSGGADIADRPSDASWTYAEQPFSVTDGSTYAQFDYVAELIQIMTAQPRLRVLMAGGWFDTAASAGADDYLMARPGLDVRRLQSVHYVGGHMFYTDPASRAAFAERLRSFVAPVRCLRPGPVRC
ncbi:peptidase S10 [Novosphingobium sp. 11B]